MKRHAKALAAVVVAMLTIGVGTALALNGHVPSPSNPFLTGLGNPQALTVDQSNGDLYVLDVGDSTVKRFDSSGAPAEFSALGSNAIDGTSTPQGGFSFDSPSNAQLAIDRSGGPADGYLYVTNSFNGVVNIFDNTGAYIDRLPLTGGEPCGVAVDPSGNVYVANAGNGRVYKYAPASDPNDVTLEGQLQNLPATPCGLAADGGGNVFVVPQYGGEVRKFESSQFNQSTPESTQAAPSATAIYLDPASGDLYVDESTEEGPQIARYGPGGNLIERFGKDQLDESMGVAINSTTGTVYASDSTNGEGKVFSFDPAIFPDATTEAATAVTDTSATLNGTIDPAGGPEADCEFEWGTEAGSYPNTAPCDPAGPFTEATAASAEISGLEPGTEYHFRIVASNAEGENPGADRTFTTVGLPIVSGLSVSDVGLNSAVLHATINPAGSDTSYRFEYVELSEFEANGFDNATSAPVPDASLAAGTSPVDVSREIEGLEEQTAYRYRLVASNEAGSASTDSQTLTTHRPAGEPELPEGRAWEMVSPRDKEGSDVRTDAGRTRALAGGDKLFFSSLHAFGDAVGTGLSAEFIAERGPDGWNTHSVTPPMKPQSSADIGDLFDPRFTGELSEDGSTGVYTSHSPISGPSNVSTIKNLYLRRDIAKPGPGTFELLTDSVFPITSYDSPSAYQAPAKEEPVFAGASANFDHVAFSARLNLTSDAPPQNASCLNGVRPQCAPRLYEHTPSGVRLVGFIPEAPSTSCSGDACIAAPRSIARGGSVQNRPDSVSSDGRRIYFAVPQGNAGGNRNIYLREDGVTTYKVNVDERTLPDPSGAFPEAQLKWITPDGEYAFFTTKEQLVDADVDMTFDVYRYDAEQPEGSHLTLISDGPPEIPATYFYGASHNGGYAYFGSDSPLNGGDPPKAQVGAENEYVYLWHAGVTTFVGTAIGGSDGVQNDSTMSVPLARVTPDGTRLLFYSSALNPLTGNVAGFNQGDGLFHETCGVYSCGRAYVYDAAANGGQGKLTCASCSTDGSRIFSNAVWSPRIEQGGAGSENHVNRPLTDDGRLVFFSVRDSLVAEDTNGRYDVYAYNLDTGEPRLISSGACACDSWFLDASPDGSDVFFTTRDRLVGWDTDSLMDVYDARVGGGFPEPPNPPAVCQGDACQPPPVALNDPTPASSSGGGSGNPKAAGRCRAGKRVAARGKKSRCGKKKGAKPGRQKQTNTKRGAGR